MEHHRKNRTSGISLIEALIALAVMAFGLLAIARLHAELTASTADSKARAEAMQIAESRVDSLRNHLEAGDGVDDTNGFAVVAAQLEETGISGVNATFDVSVNPDDPINPDAVLDPDDPDYLGYTDVEVEVSWTDARGDTQSVAVNSAVAWSNPLHSINLARGRLPGGEPLPSPSGDARTYGEVIEEADADTTEDIADADRNLELRTTGDRHQIVDIDNDEVLLETTNPDGFSVISGFLVGEGLADTHGNLKTTLRINVSDAGLCTNVAYENPQTDEFVQEIQLYRCNVGANWYGNIGLIDLQGDVSDVAGEFCVGDPTVSAGDDHQPAENARRAYRDTGIAPDTYLGRGLPGFLLPEHEDNERGWGFIPPGQEDSGQYGHHFVSRDFGDNNPSCREVLKAAGNYLDENDNLFAGNLGQFGTFEVEEN